LANITTAVTSLGPEAEVIVVLSPHASRSGVYRQPAGNLSGFGIEMRSVDAATDDALAGELADVWGLPMLDAPADHGVVIPLLLMSVDLPVVACGIAEVTGPDAPSDYQQALRDAASFADALIKVSEQRATLFVASAHTSATLTPRAPLTFHQEGIDLDASIARSLVSGPGALCDISAAAWSAGGACGAGPLYVFGRLFQDSSVMVRAYEHPYGVGYLVATAMA
jgi:hypothetical protein